MTSLSRAKIVLFPCFFLFASFMAAQFGYQKDRPQQSGTFNERYLKLSVDAEGKEEVWLVGLDRTDFITDPFVIGEVNDTVSDFPEFLGSFQTTAASDLAPHPDGGYWLATGGSELGIFGVGITLSRYFPEQNEISDILHFQDGTEELATLGLTTWGGGNSGVTFMTRIEETSGSFFTKAKHLVLTNTAGQPIWVRKMEHTQNLSPDGIDSDPVVLTDGIIVASVFDRMDSDPQGIIRLTAAVEFTKFDYAGNIVWQSAYQVDNNCNCRIFIDSDGPDDSSFYFAVSNAFSDQAPDKINLMEVASSDGSLLRTRSLSAAGGTVLNFFRVSPSGVDIAFVSENTTTDGGLTSISLDKNLNYQAGYRHPLSQPSTATSSVVTSKGTYFHTYISDSATSSTSFGRLIFVNNIAPDKNCDAVPYAAELGSFNAPPLPITLAWSSAQLTVTEVEIPTSTNTAIYNQICPTVSPPVADFQLPEQQCKDVELELIDLSRNEPSDWEWYVRDSAGQLFYSAFTPTVPLPPLPPGSYDIQLVVCNAAGIDSLTLPLLTSEDSGLRLDLPLADTAICPSELLQVDLTDLGITRFNWADGSLDSQRQLSPGATYVFDYFTPCAIFRDSVTVESLVGCCDLYWPTAFSPNQDGVNDEFRPLGNCEYASYRLVVVDRWGGIRFETEDPLTGWRGLSNRELSCSAGLYYYFLEADRGDGPEVWKGEVMLLR